MSNTGAIQTFPLNVPVAAVTLYDLRDSRGRAPTNVLVSAGTGNVCTFCPVSVSTAASDAGLVSALGHPSWPYQLDGTMKQVEMLCPVLAVYSGPGASIFVIAYYGGEAKDLTITFNSAK